MASLTSNQLCNICCIHYNAGLRCCALGSLVEGGYLFAKRGGIGWIVACASTQVTRTWTARGDAVTTAQASNACGDWFVPSKSDLLVGFACNSFWDSFTASSYWANTLTSSYSTTGWYVMFGSGVVRYTLNKTTICPVRAFRRVSY